MIPLNQQEIHKNLLKLGWQQPYDCYCLDIVDSTNNFIKNLHDNSSKLIFCCAEMQTAGRGKVNREWYSPFGENIYFSGYWQAPCNLNNLSGLSLVISLAILNSLQEYQFTQDIKVKWPNDLLWQHKKLAGVLIELTRSHKNSQSTEIIVGVGLNVNTALPTDPNNSYNTQSWCSLYDIHGQYFDRNILLAKLIASTNNYVNLFLDLGFQYFLDDWNKVDYLYGNFITVNNGNQAISGYMRGVDVKSQLCIEDVDGVLHCLGAGDVIISI